MEQEDVFAEGGDFEDGYVEDIALDDRDDVDGDGFDVDQPLPMTVDGADEDGDDNGDDGDMSMPTQSIAAPSASLAPSTSSVVSGTQTVEGIARRFLELYRSAQQHPTFPLITKAAMDIMRKKLEARGVNVDALLKNYNRFGDAAATMIPAAREFGGAAVEFGSAAKEFGGAARKFGGAAMSAYSGFRGAGADEADEGDAYEMAGLPDVGDIEDTDVNGIGAQFGKEPLDFEDAGIEDDALVY